VATPAIVPLLFLLPVAYVVARGGRDAIFNLYAADAYYYLAIAKNTPFGTLATFDGVSPTNGFHPLWQYILIAAHAMVGPSKDALVWTSFVVSTALATCAIYFLSSVVRARHAAVWPAAFLVPGVLHALVPEAGLYSLSAWRSINGMETALSLFFISLLVYHLARLTKTRSGLPWRTRDYLRLGVIAALAIWSRLDNLAIVLALPLYLLRSDHRRVDAAALLGPPLAAFAAYAAWNVAFGLPALPVSGTTKAGFELFRNVSIVADVLLAPFGVSLGVQAPAGWSFRARYLGLLLVVCSLCAVIAAATSRVSVDPVSNVRVASRRLWSRVTFSTPPLTAVCLPIVLFAAIRLGYYLACVRFSYQGFWYYTDLAIVLTAILLISVSLPRGLVWSLVGSIVWLVTAAPLARDFVTFTAAHRWCPHVLSAHGEALERCLRSQGHTKLIDFSDGLFAYFLDVETQAGTGLTANAEGYRVRTSVGEKAYHALLIARGYSVAAWANKCYSGRVAPSFATRPVVCRQPRSVHLSGLALPPPLPKARGASRLR
jgi:hypothetical protein